MVIVDGIKYACERCIRGHRVSGCSHVDKPLTMIKKKGRPATNCNHCRKNKLGKPRGPGAWCSCSDSRRERAVLTPKDLRILQTEHGIKVELSDGSVVSPWETEYGTDPSTASSSATPSAIHETPTLQSPVLAVRQPPVTGPHSAPMRESVGPRHADEFPSYDVVGSSASYSQHAAAEPAPASSDDLRPSTAYDGHEEYSSAPAFQYEAGYFGQPYSADLYNSASGNNAAAAEVNAGGESTAAVARLNRGLSDHSEQLLSMLSDDARDEGSFGRTSQLLLSAMSHHSLLATSSRDVDASMDALNPVTQDSRLREIERDQLVGGILRSDTHIKSEPGSAEQRNEPGSEENDEDYSSVNAIPELSRLY